MDKNKNENIETIQNRAANDMVVLLEFWKEKKRKLRIYRYCLLAAIVLCLTTMLGVGYVYLDQKIPSQIRLKANTEQVLNLQVPLTAQVVAVSDTSEGWKSSSGNGSAEREGLTFRLDRAVHITPGTAERYLMDVRLFGLIPVKQVGIQVMEEQELIPMGIPVGIYLETDGLLVLETGSFTDSGGIERTPAQNLLFPGDYIRLFNGQPIPNKEVFMEMIQGAGERLVALTVERDGNMIEVGLTPVSNENGEYKLGIWVRDNTQGVGTMTYVDVNGKFGALGHGINDTDTGTLMKISDGTLYHTEIVDIRQGEEGTPGEMTGMIIYASKYIMGDVDVNSEVGIYGTCDLSLPEMAGKETLPIALKQEIHKGSAQILCTVAQEPMYFDVEITDVRLNSTDMNRGIELRVTDPVLLEKTGGIVQGMSGSPVIQNGRIVGAVTHVLVNDPTRGYGIFIENMLEAAK